MTDNNSPSHSFTMGNLHWEDMQTPHRVIIIIIVIVIANYSATMHLNITYNKTPTNTKRVYIKA